MFHYCNLKYNASFQIIDTSQYCIIILYYSYWYY